MEHRRHWKWYFQTVEGADKFYRAAAEIARNHNYVTLEDLYDLSDDYVYGIPCGDTLLKSRSIRWDFDSIDPRKLSNFVSIGPAFNRVDGYYVTFYEIDPPANELTPEPINVTINMPNVTRAIIVDLIREVNEIKDRPVFITIN